MDRAELIGSPEGAAVASLLFGAIAVLIGVAVGVILTRMAAPPGETAYYLTTPHARRVIGALVALVGFALVWVWLWSGFYAATVTGRTVDLLYLVPTRTQTLPAANIVRVAWVPKPKGQRALQITMADGSTYTSATATLPVERQDAIRRQIEDAAGRDKQR